MGDNLLYILTYFSTSAFDAANLGDLFITCEVLFNSGKDSVRYFHATNHTFIFVVKLALCLTFLSAIRGGVPRYRYDFLTKMGWVKFLGLVLSLFVAVLSIHILW